MVRAEHQDLGPELSAQVRALKSEIDRGIRHLLQAGINDGSIAVADPKLAAFAIAGALNWIAHWYRAGRTLSSDQVADAFVQFLEQGLAPREPAAGESVGAGPCAAHSIADQGLNVRLSLYLALQKDRGVHSGDFGSLPPIPRGRPHA